MGNVRSMQIVVAGVLLAMAALVVIVLFVDGSDDGNSRPELVDGISAADPGGGAVQIDRSNCDRDERISWTEADRYTNQRVAVIGSVSDIEDTGNGVTLTIGRTEEETPVTVLVTQSAVNRLPETPEEMFGDDAICVIGVLQFAGDSIQVVVNEPSDVSVF